MTLNKWHELVQLRAKAASIEKKWASHRLKLLSLPQRLGYSKIGELIDALRLVQKDATPSNISRRASKKRKPRAQITAAKKAEIKKLIAAGKTGREIASVLDLSIGSVQNCKAELGLVKKRRQ